MSPPFLFFCPFSAHYAFGAFPSCPSCLCVFSVPPPSLFLPLSFQSKGDNEHCFVLSQSSVLRTAANSVNQPLSTGNQTHSLISAQFNPLLLLLHCSLLFSSFQFCCALAHTQPHSHLIETRTAAAAGNCQNWPFSFTSSSSSLLLAPPHLPAAPLQQQSLRLMAFAAAADYCLVLRWLSSHSLTHSLPHFDCSLYFSSKLHSLAGPKQQQQLCY